MKVINGKTQFYYGKKKRVCVPSYIYDEAANISKAFGCTVPKAFQIRDEIIGEIIRTKKVKGKKTRIEIELQNI